MQPDRFDPTATVLAFRDAVRRAARATDKIDRCEWERVANQLRRRWHEWCGEDLVDSCLDEPYDGDILP